MSDRITRLLPLLTAVHCGRIYGDAERSKYWVPTGDGPVRRVTAQVDELFALRPPLARRGPRNGDGSYPVLLTGAGRIELMSHEPDEGSTS